MPNDSDDKIFDVSRPGKTPAHSTSRPLITGQENSVGQDPMVSGKNPLAPILEEVEKQNIPTPLKVMEHHDLEAITPPAVASIIEPDTPPGAPEADVTPKTEETDINQAPQVAKHDTSENTPATRVDNKTAEEEAMRQKTYEKLIEDKTYFVPIGQSKESRSKLLVTGLVAILAVAAVAIWYMMRS